jgi:endoglucanase
MSKQFVHIKNGALYDIENQPILLEGVGLNAWLLPEGYMFKSYKGIDRPRKFYAWTETLLGKEASDLFWIQFRELFITENDIKLIKDLGFNSVRIPFDYEILFHASETKEKLIIKEEGFNLIDRVLKWCKKYQVYAILDLHAAPGGQTGANIDNCKHDQPELFTNELYQKQTINLWQDIALRYKDNVWVAAYDLMNEPLPEWFSKYNQWSCHSMKRS